MTKNFPSGNYTFTVGADDGVRLSIDGGITWILADWTDHGYRTVSVRVPMSGSYNLVLEYYEKGGDARVSFSYTTVSTTDYSMPNANITSIITACSGKLYDSGGSAAGYVNAEDKSVIVKPAIAGNRVKISGSINTEPDFDFLTVYDGEGTTGAILWGGSAHGSGSTCTAFTVPTVTSSTGSLTIRFKSNGSNNCAGFDLLLGCVAPVSPCTTPSNPSSVVFSTVSSTALTVGFTSPVTAPSGGYVVFRSASATTPVLTNGTIYANGTSYNLPTASYAVVSNGTAVSIPQSGLTSNTRYYYYVFSQNTSCTGQPFYSTGIRGNQITCAASPSGNVVSNITTAGVTISWNASSVGGSAATINYLLDITTNNDFTGPIAGSPFNNGTALSKVITGLNSGTTYYYRIRANNGCDSNPGLTGSFTTLLVPCSDTPVGGTTVLTPSAGLPSSAFTATVTGDTAATGLSYQWQIADSSGGPWTDIAGATGASANLTAVSFQGTVKYYRRKVICANGGLAANSVYTAFTTSSPTYCNPTATNPNALYINSFKFVGTLNDPPANVTAANGTGYADFTALTPLAEQPDGSVMNIVASVRGSQLTATWKAWVDWSGDGDFTDPGEEVYSMTDYTTEALTFGFIIPAGKTPGKYRFRIRASRGANFGPCDNQTYSDTEDYSFIVKYNCPANITAINTDTVLHGHRCGPGSVMLSAVGDGVSYNWYDTLNSVTPIATGSIYSTSIISTTTTYYVTAVSAGGCESAYRTPVPARIDPSPIVTLSSPPAICGSESSSFLITGSGDKFEDTKFDEKFDSGTGIFTHCKSGLDNCPDPITAADWQNRPSPYIPTEAPYEGLAPALQSGYFGGNYAAIVTDISRSTPILNYLTLKNSIDINGFQNLKLDYDLYYFSVTNREKYGYVKVEYSKDGGGTWTTLRTITSEQGNPNNWAKLTDSIPGPFTSTQFKVRFVLFSDYLANTDTTVTPNEPPGWKESIAAVDNIKLYGDKPLTTPFSWAGAPGIFYQSDCTTALGTTAANTVCIKPSASQIENDAFWNVSATASFSNGCPAVGSIVVPNNSKVYNTILSTDWSNATNWKPENIVPDATKCVIIKKPVIIDAATNALAKNITIEPGGKLNINGSLKVTDWVKNNAAATDVLVESDASLVQVNEGNTINTGNITARRDVNLSTGRQQYNYMISPLEGQNLKSIYSGIDYVLYHNEANNFFYNSSGAYIKGRGLAVKEAKISTTVPAGTPKVTATFTGYPTNGAFNYNLVNSSPTNVIKRGYNLIGNPYPSNLDLVALNSLNSAGGNLNSTFYLWDNRANSQTVMLGDNYLQQAYASFNTTAPPGTGTGTLATGDAGLAGTNRPTQYIKMGQGFMAQAKVNNLLLKFDNTVRTTDRGTVTFLGKGTQDEVSAIDRYWLNLITPNNLASQMAVVYFEGGNNSFTQDDSPAMGGSDGIFSFVDDQNVSINGKSAFSSEDVVELASSHFVAGEYRISLADKEGVFANSQNIYLKDRQTGILTNLSAGDYTFTANAGLSTERFEIIYEAATTLATGANAKEHIIVYRDGNDFVIKSSTNKISGVECYDAAGRLIIKLLPNQKEVRIHAEDFAKGTYWLKINYNEHMTSKKVMR